MTYGRKTSLVYIEKDGRYLILHRTKKGQDENHDKWIGGRLALRFRRQPVDESPQTETSAAGS